MKVQCIFCLFLLSELFVVPAVVHAKPVDGKKLVEKRSTSGDLARAAVLGAVSAVAYTAAAKGINKISQKLHGGGGRQQNYEQYQQQQQQQQPPPPMDGGGGYQQQRGHENY
ncbi:hypothetical protein GPALN_014350 [Globodera pallida]|nr:hypothetical protein GPALN_014350 [Globodera pallida]